MQLVGIDKVSSFATRTLRHLDHGRRSTNAPAAHQPRSRAEIALAQVSPVFVRVCATGRRPESFKTCSSTRTSNSPASIHSSLPHGHHSNPVPVTDRPNQPPEHCPHLCHSHHPVRTPFLDPVTEQQAPTSNTSFDLRSCRVCRSLQLELVSGPVDDTDEGLAGLEEIQVRGFPDWRKCRVSA